VFEERKLTKEFVENFYFLIFILMISVIFANPEFDENGDGQYDGLPGFNFDANITATIEGGSLGVVGEDYLVGMVGDEIHGVGIASSIPFGPYQGGVAYLTTVGSYIGGTVDDPGETISFYFYNGEDESFTPLGETIDFVSDSSTGSITDPFEFTLGSSYPTVPLCEDDDATVSALGGCAGAATVLGCDFVFAGLPISEICPVTCDSCPEYNLGCMDESGVNYDPLAEYHDGDCMYCEDDDEAVIAPAQPPKAITASSSSSQYIQSPS
jgi:hypothetical protein